MNYKHILSNLNTVLERFEISFLKISIVRYYLLFFLNIVHQACNATNAKILVLS